MFDFFSNHAKVYIAFAILMICFSHILQFGAFVVYFFDYTIGSGWWMMVLYVLQLCAIFVVRGKPYSGEQVATALITKAHCCSSVLIPLLAFSWHVVRHNSFIKLSFFSNQVELEMVIINNRIKCVMSIFTKS